MTDFLAVEWGSRRHPRQRGSPLVHPHAADRRRAGRRGKALAHRRRDALGRIGEPEDVARVAAFLALPASGYVSGAHVPVDGAFERVGIL